MRPGCLVATLELQGFQMPEIEARGRLEGLTCTWRSSSTPGICVLSLTYFLFVLKVHFDVQAKSCRAGERVDAWCEEWWLEWYIVRRDM